MLVMIFVVFLLFALTVLFVSLVVVLLIVFNILLGCVGWGCGIGGDCAYGSNGVFVLLLLAVAVAEMLSGMCDAIGGDGSCVALSHIVYFGGGGGDGSDDGGVPCISVKR